MSRVRVRSALILGGLVVGAVTLTRGSASAHFVPRPCDKVTSGGFVFTDTGAKANFGAHGGCKDSGPDAPFWGHLNYVDHGPGYGLTNYHVSSTRITGYLCDPQYPNARDVCGEATTNVGDTVRFRVRLIDNGEGANAACKDEFGIRVHSTTFGYDYQVSTRPLAGGGPGGGNVQLHKPNPSTTSPCADPSVDPDTCLESFVCHGLEHPGNPAVGACP